MGDIKYNKSFSNKIQFNFQKFKYELKSNREKKKNISKMCKERKYDEIYQIYGKKDYIYVVPLRYMRKDIKRLLKEGRFEDIYLKYGSATYEKYLTKMQAIDIYCELGRKKNTFFSNMKYKFKRKILPYFVSSIVFLETVPAVILLYGSNSLTEKNAMVYAEEISTYDKKINEYARNIKKLNLTDIQIIMKVMDDMWNSIEGYGEPEKNIFGFDRLDLSDENGYGVCRNMADDVTAKLNAINPDYNARNLIVTMENANYTFANIEQKEVEDDIINSVNNQTNENNQTFLYNNPHLFGNHMVTMIDISAENITLVIDPTNPSIGIFKDGEIYMFSTNDGKSLSVPYFKQYLNGTSSQIAYGHSIINSYFQDNENIELLRKKWGLDAQNKALNEVRNISENQNIQIEKENNNYMFNQNIYEESYESIEKAKQFRKLYK